MIIKPATKIYISDSGEKGRGVFASAKIKKGEIIEVCPCVKFKHTQEVPMFKMPLINYPFYHNSTYLYFCLGWGAMINHSWEGANCHWNSYPNELISFYALRDIKAGEELLYDYTGVSGKKVSFAIFDKNCKFKGYKDIVKNG